MNNLEASKAPPSSLEASDVTYTTNTIQKGGWLDFKSQFIQHDGRVIDLRQNSISHSEGQAYGLLLAVNFDDKKSFDSIWKWSKDNLQTREDNLFSWSWGKNEQQVWQVLDKNNATDGDVLIAYALMLAAKKWQQTDYLVKAKQITQSILDTLTVKVGKRTFLLPAEYGFVKKDNVRLNPSYQILAAYRLFAEQTNNKLWSTIEDDARWLIEQSFDEKSGLPADWLWFDQMTGHIVKKSNQFGYEAVRIYLYQLWESERNDFWQPWEMFERFLKSGVLYLSLIHI